MFQPETTVYLGSFGMVGNVLYQQMLLLLYRLLPGTLHLHKERAGCSLSWSDATPHAAEEIVRAA